MSAYRWLGAAWFPLQGHLVDLLLCVVLVQRYLESTQTTWLSLTAYIRLAAEAFSRSSHPLANKLVVLVRHKTAFCVVNVNSQQMGKETQTNVPQAKITYVQNYIHFGKRTIIKSRRGVKIVVIYKIPIEMLPWRRGWSDSSIISNVFIISCLSHTSEKVSGGLS